MIDENQKKSAADAHRIIYDTYGENVIVIRICANWFKRFKNSWFRYQWQRTFRTPDAAVEEDKLQKDRKNRGK